MKKIIFIMFVVLSLIGCSNVSNTPTKQVEGFFNKYQTLDKDVVEDLNRVISDNDILTNNNSQEYRDVMKKQYKDLTYKVKEEIVDADTAVVTVEITVTDFSKVIAMASDYKNNHPEEFVDNNGEYQETIYYDYVISKLKEAKDKIKYTLDIKLSKINEEWHMDKLDNETEDKILGIYQY